MSAFHPKLPFFRGSAAAQALRTFASTLGLGRDQGIGIARRFACRCCMLGCIQARGSGRPLRCRFPRRRRFIDAKRRRLWRAIRLFGQGGAPASRAILSAGGRAGRAHQDGGHRCRRPDLPDDQLHQATSSPASVRGPVRDEQRDPGHGLLFTGKHSTMHLNR